MNAEDVQSIYAWVDTIPLSRQKKHIARDFSDGCLFAEVVHHEFPKLVELHNYVPAHSVKQKRYNWDTLQQKVLRKLHFHLDQKIIEDCVKSTPGAIELILFKFRQHISDKSAMTRQNTAPQTLISSGSKPMFSTKTKTPIQSSSPVSMRKPEVFNDNAFDQAIIDAELEHKERVIGDLTQKNEVLKLKIEKLEQLVEIKDSRIQALSSNLEKLLGKVQD
eukprot:TRINITY_DN2350_c0_g1_i1.p1 TRINITY_DN2350_c0_g1~~TRINITY_DN2350_c0_g1_i1.p1  ORF type:complete len:220 (-),score=72.29 TRINITY_DN2350_c0_g1_i1:28-687(-)